MNRYKSLILLILLYCCLPVLTAQQTYPSFRHYTTDHGLPSPEVYHILEDANGFIWISTDNGISRFDGYEFHNYGPDQGLLNNVIFNMQEDDQGRIWMPTLSGNVYYYQNGRIHPYRYNDLIRKYRRGYLQIGDFYVSPTGTAYWSLYRHGLLRIDSSGTPTLYAGDFPCEQAAYQVDGRYLDLGSILCQEEDRRVRDLQTMGKDTFYVTFFDEHQLTAVPFHNDYKSYGEGDGIFNLGDGYALSYFRKNLYLFRDRKLLWKTDYPYPVSSVFHGEDGAVYIGNNLKGGLRRYDSLEALRKGEGNIWLSGYSVSHILKDRSGGLWMATIENGIFYAPSEDYLVYDQRSGLSNDYVTALAIGEADHLYIGLHNGDIFCLNPGTGKLQPMPPKLMVKEIYDLGYDHQRDRLWAASMRLQYYKDGRWQAVTGRRPQGMKWGGPPLRKLTLYPERGELLGANSSSYGFSIIDLDNGAINFTTFFNDKLKGRTQDFFRDSGGRTWVGKVKGLYEFVSDSILRPECSHQAFHLRVEDIDQLADSTLVIGTKGGGIVLWKGDHYLQINESDGLTASMVENIYIDPAQHIWVGTLNGLNKITCYSQDSFGIETMTIADGLPSNEINDITSADDRIWVATTRGLVGIPDKGEKDTEAAATPFIEQVILNNSPVNLMEDSVFLYFQNNIQLSFLTLNYKLNGNIRYRYRLKPTDEWSYTRSRMVNYAALAPGWYYFELQARNEDGLWSPSRLLAFQILPPPWQQWWFWMILALFSGSAAFFFFRTRLRQLQKESALEKELHELKQSALRAQMNPHFIFNCLNSIQGFIAGGDRANATRYLARFAKLIRATLNALLHAKVSLEEDIKMLENYLALEKMRFPEKFEYAIEVDDRIDRYDTSLPPLLVQPYVENAILHGLVDAKEKGWIKVSYLLDNGRLRIVVSDNGIGFTESRRRKNGREELHRSVGMIITKKRLELLDQSQKREQVSMEEVKNEKGEVVGANIILSVSLNNLRGTV